MNVSHILNKFGGARPLARLMDYPASTVQNWESRGSIPAKHHPRIIEIGKKSGVEVTPYDFFLIVPKSHKSPKVNSR